MNKWLIGFAALVAAATSCRKNEDITSVITTPPAAEEISATTITGLVTDAMEQGLSDTEISIFQDDRLLETTFTNGNGNFELEAILVPEKIAYLRFSKDDFISQTMSMEDPSRDNSDIQTVLFREGELPGEGLPTKDTDLIVLTGSLVDNVNAPVAGQLVIARAADQQRNYATTNRDGLFRLPVPANIKLEFQLYDRQCDVEVFNTSIGPFSEDQVLDPIQVEPRSSSQFTITGQLVDCDGAPIEGGIVIANLQGLQVGARSETEGVFQLPITTCEPINAPEVILTASSQAGTVISEPLQVTLQASATNLESPIVVCGPPGNDEEDNGGSSLIEFIVNEVDTVVFNNPHNFTVSTERDILDIKYTKGNKGLILNIPGTTEGSYEADFIQVATGTSTYFGGTQTETNTNCQVEINNIEQDRIEGTFTGNLTTGREDIIPVNGNFSISQ